ncbi:hypothetical protein B0H11DRAFT_1929738 [Mycena galericulata]|nr:hypothetical protein B0H11DRAFT_1929738 [Mycena galericulata]
MDVSDITFLRTSPGPGVSDITILQTSPTQDQDQAEAKNRQRYLQRYFLVNASASNTIESHEDRFNKVKDYFTQSPKISNALETTINLFVRIKEDTAEDTNWRETHVCPVCYSASPAASIVLSCGCRHTVYHLKCVLKWHFKAGVADLLKCPMCRTPTKPVNVYWVSPVSKAEIRARADRKHRKNAELRKSDPKRKAKEQRRKADSKLHANNKAVSHATAKKRGGQLLGIHECNKCTKIMVVGTCCVKFSCIGRDVHEAIGTVTAVGAQDLDRYHWHMNDDVLIRTLFTKPSALGIHHHQSRLNYALSDTGFRLFGLHPLELFNRRSSFVPPPWTRSPPPPPPPAASCITIIRGADNGRDGCSIPWNGGFGTDRIASHYRRARQDIGRRQTRRATDYASAPRCRLPRARPRNGKKAVATCGTISRSPILYAVRAYSTRSWSSPSVTPTSPIPAPYRSQNAPTPTPLERRRAPPRRRHQLRAAQLPLHRSPLELIRQLRVVRVHAKDVPRLRLVERREQRVKRRAELTRHRHCPPIRTPRALPEPSSVPPLMSSSRMSSSRIAPPRPPGDSGLPCRWGAHGLIGCCAATIVSSFRGCAVVAIAFLLDKRIHAPARTRVALQAQQAHKVGVDRVEVAREEALRVGPVEVAGCEAERSRGGLGAGVVPPALRELLHHRAYGLEVGGEDARDEALHRVLRYVCLEELLMRPRLEALVREVNAEPVKRVKAGGGVLRARERVERLGEVIAVGRRAVRVEENGAPFLLHELRLVGERLLEVARRTPRKSAKISQMSMRRTTTAAPVDRELELPRCRIAATSWNLVEAHRVVDRAHEGRSGRGAGCQDAFALEGVVEGLARCQTRHWLGTGAGLRTKPASGAGQPMKSTGTSGAGVTTAGSNLTGRVPQSFSWSRQSHGVPGHYAPLDVKVSELHSHAAPFAPVAQEQLKPRAPRRRESASSVACPVAT